MKKDTDTIRGLLSRAFTWVEDIVYVGLGALLAVSTLLLLGGGAVTFTRQVMGGPLAPAVVGLLDRLLLTLMIVELLYTVQVSFREHALVPEPFLIVGLVAATRRILVLTAEFGDLQTRSDTVFRKLDDRARGTDGDDRGVRRLAADAAPPPSRRRCHPRLTTGAHESAATCANLRVQS